MLSNHESVVPVYTWYDATCICSIVASKLNICDCTQVRLSSDHVRDLHCKYSSGYLKKVSRRIPRSIHREQSANIVSFGLHFLYFLFI